MAIQIIRPSAAGYSTGLTPVGSANNYAAVGEDPYSDSEYVKNTNPGERFELDLYELSNPAATGGTITNVKIYARCKYNIFWETSIIKLSLRTGGTTYEAAQQSISSGSYTWYTDSWATNPKTATSWTWSDITSLQAGLDMYCDSGLYYTACSNLYVEITYTPSTKRNIMIGSPYII